MALPQQVTVLSAGSTTWYMNYNEWMTALNLDSSNISTVLTNYAKADLNGVFGLFSTTLQMQNYVSAYVQGVAIAGVDVAQIGSANEVVSINGAGTGLEGINLTDSVRALTIVPIGTVVQYAGVTSPNGWELCDGSAISRTTYSALFGVLSTTYGVGDGSTTFNLPDTRGIFVKGAGTSANHTTSNGTAYSGTLGGYENDMAQQHNHFSVALINDGVLEHPTMTGSIWGLHGITRNDQYYFTDENYYGSGRMSTDYGNVNGEPRTGNRTQPANITLNYIIYTGVFT